MQDKDLRDNFQYWRREFDTLREKVGQLVVKECPNCQHLTVMKQGETEFDGELFGGSCKILTHFQCLTCGKKFTGEKQEILAEVK